MKKTFIILFAATFALISCEKDLEIGSVDESAYTNVSETLAYLTDANSGKASTAVAIYSSDYETEIVLNIATASSSSVSVTLSYDSDYVDTYNSAHGTSYEAYPSSGVSLGSTSLTLSAGSTVSSGVSLSIAALDEEGTYLLPIKATGTGVSEQECVWVVTNYAVTSTAERYDGEKSVFCILECNDTNPLNVLQWKLEDGRYFTDYVCLFAANINYDSDAGEIYVYCNTQITYILENYDQVLKPLKEAGIKVILGILGNWDESGCAQLSELGAQHFAKKLAAICDAYDLDGVFFDDEYSGDPDLDNPLFTEWSVEAGSRLMYECKQAMPDKIVVAYQYQGMYGTDSVDDVDADEWVDIVIGDYRKAGVPFGSIGLEKCSGYSTEMNYVYYYVRYPQWYSSYGITQSRCEEIAASDYGYYMIFAPWASGYQGSSMQLGQMEVLAEGFYGQGLQTPEYYYASSTSLETSEYSE